MRAAANRPRRAAAAAVLAALCAGAVLSGPGLAGAQDASPGGAACQDGEQHPFEDVAGSVHETAIGCAVRWQLTQGTSATTYSPAAPVTRGQLATFLDRLLTAAGAPLPPATQDRFDDDGGSTHAGAVDRLAEAGIVQGIGPRTFHPAAAVTRAQSVALVVRTHDHLAAGDGRPPLPAGPDAFGDDDGSVLEAEVDRAAAAGLTTGTGPRTFSPLTPVRRDQAASLLVRLLDLELRSTPAAPSAGPSATPSPSPTPGPSVSASPTPQPTASSPVATPTASPSPTEPVVEPPPAPVTVVAAADNACPPGDPTTADRCVHAATAALVEQIDPVAVLLPGDVQNEDGSIAEYTGDGGYTGTWSRLLSRSWPAPGNHDWQTPGAAGYRHVFDGRTGGRWWYSFDVGAWHVVSLSSDCAQVGGCGVDSAQHQWFLEDLAAHDGTPTLVFWHHPRFSAGWTGSLTRVDALWRSAAADRDVQLVLNGHDHSYQRHPGRDADGGDDSSGLRQFIVGTGGQGLHCRGQSPSALPAQVYDCTSFGVLRLELRHDGYDWQFERVTGSQADAGSSPLRP